MSDGSLRKVTREREATLGVIVGAARDIVNRFSGGGTRVHGETEDDTVDGSGNVRSTKKTARGATYQMQSNLRYLGNHGEKEECLRSAFAAAQTETATDIAITAATKTISSTSTDFTTKFSGAVGLMLEVGALTPNAAFAGRIKSVATNAIVLEDPITIVLQDAVAGPSVSLKIGSVLKNGITKLSANFEEELQDQPAPGSFWVTLGAIGASYGLTFSNPGKIEETYQYEALDYNDSSTATVGNGTVNVNAGDGNEFMDSANNLKFFYIGATRLDNENLMSFSLEANQGARARSVAGTILRKNLFQGDCRVSGQMQLYLDHAKEAALTTLERPGTKAPICFKVEDVAGNFYWVVVGQVLLAGGGPAGGPKNTDIGSSYNYTGSRHTGMAATLAIQAFGA